MNKTTALKFFKIIFGGIRGGGGQGRCERRSEVFVKIKKKNYWGEGGGEGRRGMGLGGGGGQDGCE